MSGIEAMLYYLLWTILVLFMYVGHRVPLILLGKKAGDAWSRGKVTDDAAFFVRASHAHANCIENFALFAAVVLGAAALGQSAAVDGLAAYVLYARIGQTITHLIGTSTILVLVRATFFVVQILLVAYMAFNLTQGAAV